MPSVNGSGNGGPKLANEWTAEGGGGRRLGVRAVRAVRAVGGCHWADFKNLLILEIWASRKS
jgi:hypothetical protein